MSRASFPLSGTDSAFGRYVGRVGALAVALGVGAAVATGQGIGIARADDDGSSNSASSNDSATSTDSSADATVASATTATTPSDASAGSGSHSAASAGPTVPKMKVQVSGTATVSGQDDDDDKPADKDPVTDPTAPTRADESDSVEDAETAAPPAPAPIPPVADSPPTASKPDTDTLAAPVHHAESTPAQSDSSVAEPTAVGTAPRASAATASAVTPPQTLRTTSFAAAAPAPAPAPVAPPALQPQDPISALITLPGAVLSAFLSPFLTPGPVAPPRPPLLLAVLSLVAREIERVLFNATPVVRSQQVDITLQNPGDVSAPISFGANDADGETLVYAVPARGALGGPSRGTVTVDQATGTFVYDPDDALAAAGGTDTFTVTVTDAAGAPHLHGLLGLFNWGTQGHTSTAIITVNVSTANQAPVAVDDAFTTNEDTALTGNVLANDHDSDSTVLTTALGAPPAHGTVTMSTNGIFTYTPAANFNGTDSFTYTVSDGSRTATASVTINVIAVNDAPVAVDDAVTTNEDTPVVVDVLANDTDPDSTTLTVTVATGATHGVIVVRPDNTVQYTPNPGYSGTDTFTYTVSDGEANATGAVTVTVVAVDDPIAAIDDSATTDEDTDVTGNVLTNDRAQNPDGSAEVITVTPGTFTTANGGTVTLAANGAYTYTPKPNFNGIDTFTYTVRDAATSATGTVTITVTSVNDPITAIDDEVTIDEDSGRITGNVLTNDRAQNPDGPGEVLYVTPTGFAFPSIGVLDIAPDGTYSFTPARNYNGTFTRVYTVTDEAGHASTATLTITVRPVNDPVTAVDEAVAIDEDADPITGNVLANDRSTNPDGPNEQLTIVNPRNIFTALGSLALQENGDYTFTPAADANGTVSFSYTFTDGEYQATGTLVITIRAVNDPVVAVDDFLTIAEESGSYWGDVLGNDRAANPDGLSEPLSVFAFGPTTANGGVTMGSNGIYTYTPPPNFNGTIRVPYTVTDGTSTATGILTIVVTPVNDPPTAPVINSSITDSITGKTMGAATSTDVDRDTLVFSGTTTTTKGSVVVNANGTFTYTPTQAARETMPGTTDSFAITVSDGTVTRSTTVTVAIEPVYFSVGTATVGLSPNGIALTPNGTRAYVANQSGTSVSVVNLSSNTVIATIPVAATPTVVAMSPNGARVYVSSQSGTVSVIDTATNTVAKTLTVGGTPFGMAISPDGSRVYVATYSGTAVAVIDTATDTLMPGISVGAGSRSVAISADGSRLYATLGNPDQVAVIDTASRTVIATVDTISINPNRIVVSPDGTRAYVTSQNSNNVEVINLTNNTVVTTIAVQASPNVLVLSPDGSRLFVTSTTTSMLTVIDTAKNAEVRRSTSGAAAVGSR